MLKKGVSLILVLMLLTSLFSSFSAGAATADDSNDTSLLSKLTLQADNNIATYLDENGNVVDLNSLDTTTYARKARVALPSSYDLRDHSRSTSVKNQGNQGMCWSFASTASMESNILTQDLNTSDTLDLSEAGNSWFLHTNTNDPSSPVYNDFIEDDSKGANGGTALLAADSLSSGYGAYPEELVSYDNFVSGYADSLRFYSDYRLKEFTILPYDIDLIKQQIMDKGALYYTYYSFDENYHYAENGMQTYCDNGTSINGDAPYNGHAVTVIGWDDNFSKDNFHPDCNVKNDGAWLCKNSWGDDYQKVSAKGYEGYFWVSYESNACDVCQFEMQDAESFDNIYQHQATGELFLLSGEQSAPKFFSAANVFTASSNEKLEQICFSNIDKDEVTVKIYKLNENYTSPVDGELLTEFTVNVDFSGTHCVDVPKDIVFDEGDIFSVVVESENLITKFKAENFYSTDETGKSYLSTEHNTFIDVAQYDDISYAAIKAYTTSTSVNKTELTQLVKSAKELKAANDAEQSLVDEIKSVIATAEKLLADENATNHDIKNTYCVLKSKCDTLETYSFYINDLDDFMTFYHGLCTNSFDYKYVELNTDLDLTDVDMDIYYSSADFYGGVFNGNGHTIKNLTLINTISENKAGLFGTFNNSVIKDITFDSANVEQRDFWASIVTNSATNSQFINCNVINSTVKCMDSMQVSTMAVFANNCTFENCTVENTKVIGGYCASLYFSYIDAPSTVVDCTASNYTLYSSSYAEDNLGFSCQYTANSYDGSPMITVTDDSCVIEEFIGEIESVEYNGEILTAEDGVYTFDKEDSTLCPHITIADFEIEKFVYTPDLENKAIRLLGYFGTDTDIEIPETLYGKPVTSFADEFFFYEIETSAVTSISIPGSVKTFNSECFTHFQNLQSLTINEGVETIGSLAFFGCGDLSQINLPDSLRTIGDRAFTNCNATDIVLGKNIEEIGDHAFGYRTGSYKFIPIEGFTIHGYAGTAAEAYANENGFNFVDLSTTE